MLPDRAAAHADASALGVALDDHQADRLIAYLQLLQRWNRTYNLTAVRDPAAMWRQHVLDCLAAVPALGRHLPSGRPVRVLDVGSGGGLPGVVWAVALPTLDITCVDAVAKKNAFVRQVAGALHLPQLHPVQARVESLHAGPFDLITSRAFASIADFVRLTRHLLAAEGRWLAMKGKPPLDELRALAWPESMFHVEPLHVAGLDADRCLVWLQDPERAKNC